MILVVKFSLLKVVELDEKNDLKANGLQENVFMHINCDIIYLFKSQFFFLCAMKNVIII